MKNEREIIQGIWVCVEVALCLEMATLGLYFIYNTYHNIRTGDNLPIEWTFLYFGLLLLLVSAGLMYIPFMKSAEIRQRIQKSKKRSYQ